MTAPVTHHQAIRAGRTAVITGAASGIGLAAAGALATHGMRIAMIDLPGEKLDAAAAGLKAAGANVLAIGADVSEAGAMAEAAAQVARELPPVTVLMNNAGLAFPSSTLVAGPAWQRTLAVNLWGVIHGSQAFAQAMIGHGEPGVIINTGSKQGITTPPGNPAYNLSKAGVKTFTEALAHELRETTGCAISAHLFIPGWVYTPLTARHGGPKPAGAWTPEQTVEFLLASLSNGDFYILCPDNETSRSLDEQRIAWAAGDIIENRPALSRWHNDHAAEFKASLRKD
jgi:NAD(P)-dependent dehydrogenase (short-subunit alcohol dehydrogenase family)